MYINRGPLKPISDEEVENKMDFRNCTECGKPFRFIASGTCPACIESDENDLRVVYDYVRKNKGAGIKEASDATGVSAAKIIRFLRDRALGTIEMADHSLLRCSRCDQPIPRGNLCEDCTVELIWQINKRVDSQSLSIHSSSSSRMYTCELTKCR